MKKQNTAIHLARTPALVTVLILIIPFVAIQYTAEVNWTVADFLVAGVLLFGTGLGYRLVTRNHAHPLYKLAVGFALFVALFHIWVNLAVGITGSSDNPVNLLYFGVILVGIIGVLRTRFKVRAMIWVMLATAAAHAFIGIILSINIHSISSSWLELWGPIAFFIALIVLSAFLFHYASVNRLQDPS